MKIFSDKLRVRTGFILLLLLPGGFSKTMASMIKEENITYQAGGQTFRGYVAYDAEIRGKRPVVLIVHEWWGLNDYPRMRARMVAELGYLAVAVDLYGDGKTADDPAGAQALAGSVYRDPALIRLRMDAAREAACKLPQADPHKIAAMGYCFGGFVVLNYAKQGAPLQAVVSFHGGLGGVPADKKLLKAKILVCHGGADRSVTEKDLTAFRNEMDSIGADYTVRVYPGATHAFTNPASTENGKKFNIPIEYNADADHASWEEMKQFFRKVFGV
jgi:dienelactone hydrolase